MNQASPPLEFNSHSMNEKIQKSSEFNSGPWQRSTAITFLFTVLLGFPRLSLAQEPSDDSQASSIRNSNSLPIAFVGEHPIYEADVLLQLGKLNSKSNAVRNLPNSVRDQTVSLIAKQRQAVLSLQEINEAADSQKVDDWIENNLGESTRVIENTSNLPTADEILRSIEALSGVTPASYRSFIQFRISWQPYLKKHLTTANMKRFFEQRQARFDGTKFRILLQSIPVPLGDSRQRDEAEEYLQKLRTSEEQGNNSTEDAANVIENNAAHQIEPIISGPTWFSGMGGLEPKLMDIVIGLKDGETSSAINTATGVHVVTLLETQKGDLPLEQVQDSVRSQMLIYLLDYLAEQSEDKLPLRLAKPTP